MSFTDEEVVASGRPSDGRTGGMGAAWMLPPLPQHGGERTAAPKSLDETMNMLTSMLADMEQKLLDHNSHEPQLDGEPVEASPLPTPSLQRQKFIQLTKAFSSVAQERHLSGGGRDGGSDIASSSAASTSMKKPGSQLGSHGDKWNNALDVHTPQLAGLEKELQDHNYLSKTVNLDKFASGAPGSHQSLAPDPSLDSELDAMTLGIMRLRSNLALSSSDDLTEGPEAAQQPDVKRTASPRMGRPAEAWSVRSLQQPDVAGQPIPVHSERRAEQQERSRTPSPCPELQFSTGQAQHFSASQRAVLASPLLPRRELPSEAQHVGDMQSPVVSRTLSPPHQELPHESFHLNLSQQQDLVKMQSPTRRDLPPEGYHHFAPQQPESARALSPHRRELPPQACHHMSQQQPELARGPPPPRRGRLPEASRLTNPQQPELARAPSPARREQLPEAYHHTTQQPELAGAPSTPHSAYRNDPPQQQEFSRAPSPPRRDLPSQAYHHTTQLQAALAYERFAQEEPKLPRALITPGSELPPETYNCVTIQQPDLVRAPSPPRREQLTKTLQQPELARSQCPPRREQPHEGYHHMKPQHPELVRAPSPSRRELQREGYQNMNPPQPELVRATSPTRRELPREVYHHMNPQQPELVRAASPSRRELPREGLHHINPQQPDLVRAASPSRRGLHREGYNHMNPQQPELVRTLSPCRRELLSDAYHHIAPQRPELVRAPSPSRRELPPEGRHHMNPQPPELLRASSPSRRELPLEGFHHMAQATPQAIASVGQSQQLQHGLQGQLSPLIILGPAAQPAPPPQPAPPVPPAPPPLAAVVAPPVSPQLQPGLQVQSNLASQTIRPAPTTQGVPTQVFPHLHPFQIQMNPLIANHPGMAPGIAAPASPLPVLPGFQMQMPGLHARSCNLSRASSGHALQQEWANVPLGLPGRAHSTSSCGSSFDYSKFVPQWVPPGSSLRPASMYVADPTDRIDAVFSRSLLDIGKEQASRLMLRRKGQGKYEIDGRQVTVSWQAEGVSHELVVREDDIADGLPVPLETYLAQASNVAIALAGRRAGSPAVARIPKEKRLTFREAATDAATAAIENLGNERSESMKIAVEQARVREQAAAAYEHTVRQNAAMAPGGMPIPSLVA